MGVCATLHKLVAKICTRGAVPETNGDVFDVCQNRFDCLAKRWPRKMAKVKVGSRRPAALTRTLGSQQIDVLGVLGEGAFGAIFSCKISEGQHNVAVKVERQVRKCRLSLFWLLIVSLKAYLMLLPQSPFKWSYNYLFKSRGFSSSLCLLEHFTRHACRWFVSIFLLLPVLMSCKELE